MKLKVVDIARVCHEADRALSHAFGDAERATWDRSPLWQQETAISGVLSVIDPPDATPEDIHCAWMNEKFRQGWRFGPVKDAEAKTHPCLMPWAELSPEQRLKDELFLAIVIALKSGLLEGE